MTHAAQTVLPLDLDARPLRSVPRGAVPVGPVALCAGCGALTLPFAVIVDDPLSCLSVFFRPERRDPLCLDCTVIRVRREALVGAWCHPGLVWALEGA